MPKVKLLLVITQSVWGGAQKYVYDLATNLPRQYEVTVATGPGGELLTALRKAGVRTVEIPELVRQVNPVKDLTALFRIWSLARRERFDIIHTNSSKAGVLGRLAGKAAGVGAVTYTIHGLVLNEQLSPLTKAIYWLMERIGGIFSDDIIAVSEKDKQSAVHYGLKSPSQVKVIPVGIEPFQITKTKHSDVVVGTIANFFPAKGYRYYLPAIKETLTKFPDVRFEIVGVSGPDKNWVLGEVKRLGSRVKILSIPDRAQTKLADFDIFVLPSVKEGMPYTIIEAMMAGLPIVATRVGGVPEEITAGKSGLLVPPRDSQALAEAIEKLIGDEKLRSELGEGAERDSGQFTLEKMVARTDQFYRGLLR